MNEVAKPRRMTGATAARRAAATAVRWRNIAAAIDVEEWQTAEEERDLRDGLMLMIDEVAAEPSSGRNCATRQNHAEYHVITNKVTIADREGPNPA